MNKLCRDFNGTKQIEDDIIRKEDFTSSAKVQSIVKFWNTRGKFFDQIGSIQFVSSFDISKDELIVLTWLPRIIKGFIVLNSSGNSFKSIDLTSV